MKDVLRPVLELTVVFPGLLLAYFPVGSYLKLPPAKLAAGAVPLLLGLCLGGGLLCYHFGISTAFSVLLITLTAIFLYRRTLRISLWKSGTIALAVCAVFACLNSLSRAVGTAIVIRMQLPPDKPWFCFGACIFYNAVCWLITAAAYYPATHAVRAMVEDDNFAQTWYVFWVLPLVFILLNLFITPRYQITLRTGRVLQVYIVMSIALLFLMIATLWGQSVGIFFLYFISGVFAACLFQHLEQEFAIGIPLFLSLFCLLLCETANVVLLANEHLSLEQFLVPAANLIVSGILLLGILKIFSGTVVFRDRVKYLELNDTENQVLVKYREEDRSEYFLCVHTAYFCERIANKLELDRDALKCAGLYHRKGWDLMQETPDMKFPAGASEILEEYKGTRKYKKAETAVLYCSDAVVSAILLLLQKEPEKKPDYEQVIDRIFERIREKGIFSECDLSLRGWNRMQKIFKEEKLYYDFLR